MKRILLSWSSGKDSAWSLHVLRQRGEYEVAGLLTTFNDEADRVAMHPGPRAGGGETGRMAGACARAVAEVIEGIAFGDLFLEDVRAYRVKQMKNTGLQPIFPVWGLPTRALALEMIAAGVRAKLSCVDTEKLDRSFAGRE